MKIEIGLLKRLCFILLLLASFCQGIPASDNPLRKLLIRDLYFTAQTGPDGDPMFVIRARTSVENLLDKQVTLESTIRRADGSPLRLLPAAPNYLSEENGIISYKWSGPLQGLREGDDLYVPVPVNAIAGGSQGFQAVIRYTITSGRLKSYLESQTSFPRPDAGTMKLIKISDLRHALTSPARQSLNVAGMGSLNNTGGEDSEIQTLSLDFGVSGIQGKSVYIGAVFRHMNGDPVRPSSTCPPGNVGQGNRVQVQRSEIIQASPSQWTDLSVQVPLHWMDLNSFTPTIIAGVYTSADGLWGYAETELDLLDQGLGGINFISDETPEDEQDSASLFTAARTGDTAKLKQLISSGADVRKADARGQVPLHAAAEAGRLEAANILIVADQIPRAKAEIPASPEEVNKLLPTVDMIDSSGRTPLHLSALKGSNEVSGLLLENGADPEAVDYEGHTPSQLAETSGHAGLGRMLKDAGPGKSSSRTRRTTSRYTVPLKDILIELEAVNRQLAQLRSSPNPDQGMVRSQGQELARVIGTFQALFRNAPITRIGTIEDLQLVRRISEVQEEASWNFQSMAIIPGEEGVAGPRRHSPTLLEEAGRELIEREVISWVNRKGLGDLLADGGKSQLTGSVNQKLQIDMRGFLDKKAQEVLGMPLRGLRSLQAAFRLQAQRHIRETVAQLVLNFTGNRLVLTLLQNTILDWAENQLWPRLREAFRPKGNLPHRVNVSIGTMQEASRALFNLSRGRDPGMIPLEEVLQALDRASGTIHAARYLEKDLNRSSNAELKDLFFREMSNLRLAMRVVMGQFMIYDDEQDGEFAAFEIFNRFDYIEGIHEDVLDVLSKMGGTLHEMRIWNPSSGELRNGMLPFRPEYFQKFFIAIYKLPEEQLTGIKKLQVWIHDQAFVLYGTPDQNRKLVEFSGYLPMPQGQYTVRLECRDIPGVSQEELLFHVAADQSPGAVQRMGQLQQRVSRAEQAAAAEAGGGKGRKILSLADEIRYAARQRLTMGDVQTAKTMAERGVSLALQSGDPNSNYYLDHLYRLQADIALLEADRNQFIRFQQMKLQAKQQDIEYRRRAGRSDFDINAAVSVAAEASLRTAEILLMFGANPSQVQSFVEQGINLRNESGSPARSFRETHPNIAALFQLQ